MIRWFHDTLSYGMISLAMLGIMWIVKIVPGRVIFWFSERLADIGYHLFVGFRKRSISNLRLALGSGLAEKQIRGMARRSLRNFFRAIAELGHALSADPRELRKEIPLVGRELLEEALAKKKGVIILGAHLGNFFMVGMRLAIEGYPVHVLVKPPRNRAFGRLMDQIRTRTGLKTINSSPTREASHNLVEVLRRNEMVIVIADEFRSGNGISVTFFDRTVSASRGPATLALRTGAAVVPAYVVRGREGALAFNIEPEIQIMRPGRINEDVAENTERFTSWLERVVRSYPDQWNWMNFCRQESSSKDAANSEEHQKRMA